MAAANPLVALQRRFLEEQAACGVRRTWGCLPTARPKGQELPIKPAVLFTPLQDIPKMPVVRLEPIRCTKCGAINSQFNVYDKAKRILTCSFCGTKLLIPGSYPLNQSGYPQEMCLGTRDTPSAVEYVYSEAAHTKRRLMFLVDVSAQNSEIALLKEVLLSSLAMLPEGTEVGLVTVGASVNIHSFTASQTYVIGTDMFNSAGSFRGGNDDVVSNIDDILGRVLGFDYKTKYMMPLNEVLEDFSETVEQVLVQDPWATPGCLQRGLRPYNALGLGIAVAARILMDGELVVFSSGPITVGPGLTVIPEMRTPIRGWDDINSHTHGSEATQARQSTNFFNSLIPLLSSMKSDTPTQSANIDLFSPSVGLNVFIAAKDQTGLLEMRGLIEGAGGEVFLCESYSDVAFAESLRLLLESGKGLAKKGIMELSATSGVSITNVIGHGIPLTPSTTADLAPVSRSTANNSVGGSVGSTSKASNRWGLGYFDKRTTIEIDLDMKLSKKAAKKGEQEIEGAAYQIGMPQTQQQQQQQQQESLPALVGIGDNTAVMQIRFYYCQVEGTQRLRVVTFPFKLMPNVDINMFDQEAAIVSMARKAMNDADCGVMPQEITVGIDTAIIRMCREFGHYTPGRPETFTIPPAIQLLPLFSFHLRRASYITLRDTPDITALQRFRLLKSGVIEGVRIIQPPLLVYTASNPAPVPVPLDSSSAQSDRVMLLDTTDRIIVWYGRTVAAWRDGGWCDKPGYENVRTLVNKPVEDAKRIQASRYPSPRLTVCDEGTSQARFLLSRVNPSGDGVSLTTSDISLARFIESLKQLAVKPAE